MDQNKKRLQELSITINADYADYNFKLNGINSIQEFFEDEVEYWEKTKTLNFQVFNEFIIFFKDCRDRINNFIKESENYDDNQFRQQWNVLSKQLSRTITKQRGNYPLVYSNTPQASFLIELVEENETHGLAGYNYFLDRKTNVNNSRDLFIGYLKAYEFDMQGNSTIKKRRNNERISLGKIRSKWDKKTSALQNMFDKITANFDEDSRFLIERVDRWNRLKILEIKRTFTNLEKSYSDKLKLEKPVEYWQDLAKDYKISGYCWVGALGVLSVLMISILLFFIYLPPESFSAKIINGDPLAIKNIILFATLISVMAYAIKTSAKLALSSFHLRRDAREREQLTLVYLALLKGGSISREERDLVLEAIFNRSDTGLIKGDTKEQTLNTRLLNR